MVTLETSFKIRAIFKSSDPQDKSKTGPVWTFIENFIEKIFSQQIVKF